MTGGFLTYLVEPFPGRVTRHRPEDLEHARIYCCYKAVGTLLLTRNEMVRGIVQDDLSWDAIAIHAPHIFLI